MDSLDHPKNHPNIVITEDDGRDLYLDALLAADTSPVRTQVQCTEGDDLDLDDLLRKDYEPSARSLSPPRLSSVSPPPSFSPLSAAATSVEEKASPPFSSPQVNQTSILKSPLSPRCLILAREEDNDDDNDGVGHWINPPPAQPGDFLNNSIRRVPSKSILKKVSSYGNFDTSLSISSHNAGRSLSQAQSSACTVPSWPRTKSESMEASMGKKKTSFLSMPSSNSNHSENSGSSSFGIGLDLGDSFSIHNTPRKTSKVCLVDKNDARLLENIPPMPLLSADADHADRAAGIRSMDLSSSDKKMQRSVSFHSVDIREYDRTIGDNPSCRSGPPLSLDWSYSKKYEQPKCLDEYEKEREPERVQHWNKLHVNKYRRRNLLAFNWGHSEEELKSARQETKKLQRQRSMTQMLLPIHLAEEAFISVKSFVSKKRGKAESPKQEMQRVTSELSLSLSMSNTTRDLSNSTKYTSPGRSASTAVSPHHITPTHEKH